MPNSYSAIPNIFPGNVTVQGALLVNGQINGTSSAALTNQLTMGATPPLACRVFPDLGIGPGISANLLASGGRGDGATGAYALILDAVNKKVFLRMVNTAGSFMDVAPRVTIASDYAQHVHTGTVTVDAIYSRVIRGGLIGANGGVKLTTMLAYNANGASVTTLSFVFGGVSNTIFATATAVDTTIEVWMVNQNALNVQRVVCRILRSGQAVAHSIFALAVDTSADQTLAVTMQNGTGTDQQTFYAMETELLNTFGPVV